MKFAFDILKEEEKVHRWVKRKFYAEKDFFEILGAQMISSTISIIAGSLIAFYKDNLLIIPGLLILIPGFLEMKGAVFGSLTARLSSALHVHKKITHMYILQNALASFILAFVLSLALGIITFFLTKFIFQKTLLELIFFPVVASIISSIILIPAFIKTTIWLFRHKYEPDDIMGPYITSLGDIVSTIALIIAVAVI